MTIVVNGESRTIAEDATIAVLLHELDLARAACAVELNRAVIPKSKHPTQTLSDGDQVEIVTLVGGG